MSSKHLTINITFTDTTILGIVKLKQTFLILAKSNYQLQSIRISTSYWFNLVFQIKRPSRTLSGHMYNGVDQREIENKEFAYICKLHR